MGIELGHTANKYKGIVLSIKNNTMNILLSRGGKISVPARQDIHIGQSVCLLLDTLEKQVVNIITQTEADNLIKCGSDRYSDTLFEPLESIEIMLIGEDYGDIDIEREFIDELDEYK